MDKKFILIAIPLLLSGGGFVGAQQKVPEDGPLIPQIGTNDRSPGNGTSAITPGVYPPKLKAGAEGWFTEKNKYYIFIPAPGLFNFEMRHGSENLFTFHSIWSAIDNEIIPTTLPFLKKRNALTKTINISYRLAKLFLVDYPINFVLPSLNHEFVGHGMRVYQANGRIAEIRTPLPPPFMSSFPLISYYKMPGVLSTQQQDIAITIGGSEANTIMAEIIRKNVLVSGYFDYHASFLYLYANNDLNGYAAFAGQLSDIKYYIENINILYKDNNKKMDNTKLLAYGIVGILGDPLNYYSFFNIFKNYLVDGSTRIFIPWIPLSHKIHLHYLPKVRFGLTPYGVEFFVDNYVKHRNTVYSLVVGFTDGTFDSSWRVQTKIWNIFIARNMSMNVEAQLWYQPEIQFFINNTMDKSEGLGGAVFLDFTHDALIRDVVGIMLQLGYKSPGFMEGELLQGSFIARLAFSLSFRL